MLGVHQDGKWPPNRDIFIKYALIAHRDAQWPAKHHLQIKINAECPPNDKPGAHQNATWPAKETAGD